MDRVIIELPASGCAAPRGGQRRAFRGARPGRIIWWVVYGIAALTACADGPPESGLPDTSASPDATDTGRFVPTGDPDAVDDDTRAVDTAPSDPDVGDTGPSGDTGITPSDASPDEVSDVAPSSCDHEGFVLVEQEFATHLVPNDQWWSMGVVDQKRSALAVWFHGDATATHRAPGRYPLSFRRDCTECVYAYIDCTEDGSSCESIFAATGGTLVITRWDDVAHRAEGYLESLVLSELAFDELSDKWVLAPSGERWCIDRVDIGATLADTRVGWSLTGDTTTTGRGGGAGELNSASACPAGFIGAGVTGTAFRHPALLDWYLTSYAIRCHELTPEGMGIAVSDGDAVVEGGGGDFTASTCDDGWVMVGVRYGLNSDPRVEGLAALCALFDAWMDPQQPALTLRARVIGQVDATDLTCPRGYALTAVNARTDDFGNGIYSVQGTCSRVAR